MAKRIDPTPDELREILASADGWGTIGRRYGHSANWVREIFRRHGATKPSAASTNRPPLTEEQKREIDAHPEEPGNALADRMGIGYDQLKAYRRRTGWDRSKLTKPEAVCPAPRLPSAVLHKRTDLTPKMTEVEARAQIDEHIRLHGVTLCPPRDAIATAAWQPPPKNPGRPASVDNERDGAVVSSPGSGRAFESHSRNQFSRRR